MNWIVEKTNDLVTTLRIEAIRNKSWEQWVFLGSDEHLDNPHCQRHLYSRHLNQAVEREAPVFSFGDFFCAMQGKKDPRGQKEDIRPENNNNDYYGSLVRTNFDFIKPYIKNYALFGVGNHESKIIKHSEIDLTAALVDRMQDAGSSAIRGGYRGWVRFLLKGGNQRQSFTMYYTHGSGGSAPVTKGVIRTNRRASFIDADIVVGGHIHEAWCMELCKAGITDRGNEIIKDQIHLCLPTYKEEFLNVGEGFHAEKEGSPKPLGGWWLRFFYCPFDSRFKVDYMRAK